MASLPAEHDPCNPHVQRKHGLVVQGKDDVEVPLDTPVTVLLAHQNGCQIPRMEPQVAICPIPQVDLQQSAVDSARRLGNGIAQRSVCKGASDLCHDRVEFCRRLFEFLQAGREMEKEDVKKEKKEFDDEWRLSYHT